LHSIDCVTKARYLDAPTPKAAAAMPEDTAKPP